MEIHKPSLQQLFPKAEANVPLKGLYLRDNLLDKGTAEQPFVYSNYIVSLDGRIAMEHPETGHYGPPKSITNPRDWRLFQELAAQADVIVVSGRYLRELAQGSAQAALPVSTSPGYEDLSAWRVEQGLSPQPTIATVSASLDLPYAEVFPSERQGIVLTGEEADSDKAEAIEEAGGKVLRTNPGRYVEGAALVRALGDQGCKRIYAVGGPVILETVMATRKLDRLYLTHAQRVLGGKPYDSILEGGALNPAADFHLHSLYYDAPQSAGGIQTPGQLYACYDLNTT